MGISINNIGNNLSFFAVPEKSRTNTTLSGSVFSMIRAAASTASGVVTPSGTSSPDVLAKAPSPKIKVAGKEENAKIVVDLSKNVLYHYDDNGNPLTAYSISSGKPSTPTSTGVRKVSHVEVYPYRTAPKHTKRRRNPAPYGPKIIILDEVNTKTGETSSIGEFIHGNNAPSDLGKYVSHGCMRMDNEVIKYLSSVVKRGDYVNIIK